MSRLTLSDALAILTDDVVQGHEVFPRGATEAQQIALLNRACQMLIGKPGWRGSKVITTFSVYNNQITLPRSIESVQKAAVPPGGSCFTNVPVNNLWFQFHVNGPGMIDPAHPRIARAALNDLGLGFVTFLDPSAPFYIRVVSDIPESDSTEITFTGLDTNSKVIYQNNSPGVTLDCSVSPSTTSQVFASLNGVIKNVSKGRISIYAVDATSAVATLMAIYDPGETKPCYRRYFVSGSVSETRTFTGLCKRAYVKLVSGNDEVYPDNDNALSWALKGLICMNQNEQKEGEEYFASAVQILNDELGEYLADSSPSIQIQTSAFAGARIRNLDSYRGWGW